MWEGLSGGCRAGLTLEGCSQLAVFAIQPGGSDAAAALCLVEDGVPRCERLFRVPIWCPSGGGGTREAGSTVAESLIVLFYRVGTYRIRRRQRAPRSSTSHGSTESLCARTKGVNREVSEGKPGL